MKNVMDTFKVTLSTGKIVLLREPKISDQELAAKAAGGRVGGNQHTNQIVMGSAMQKEMLKLLIVAIGQKVPEGEEEQPPQQVKPGQLENLDNFFSYAEYMQLAKVLEKVLGGDDVLMGNFEIEMLSSGS